MLTKQQISYLKSLHQKKFRQMYGKFLVEGDKPVRELLASTFKVDAIYALPGWQLPAGVKNIDRVEVSEKELERISTLETPHAVVAVAHIPAADTPPIAPTGLYLCLDNLNDPGNAGTIIRIADWFGIKQVYLSPQSVDVYNPKVVSAAKGSLFRVGCSYTNLPQLLSSSPLPVYGTFMQGNNLYKTALPPHAVIVIGNEANGISAEVRPFITHPITIPSFGHAESLNAGVAAGIVVSEFKRGEG